MALEKQQEVAARAVAKQLWAEVSSAISAARDAAWGHDARDRLAAVLPVCAYVPTACGSCFMQLAIQQELAYCIGPARQRPDVSKRVVVITASI